VPTLASSASTPATTPSKAPRATTPPAASRGKVSSPRTIRMDDSLRLYSRARGEAATDAEELPFPVSHPQERCPPDRERHRTCCPWTKARRPAGKSPRPAGRTASNGEQSRQERGPPRRRRSSGETASVREGADATRTSAHRASTAEVGAQIRGEDANVRALAAHDTHGDGITASRERPMEWTATSRASGGRPPRLASQLVQPPTLVWTANTWAVSGGCCQRSADRRGRRAPGPGLTELQRRCGPQVVVSVVTPRRMVAAYSCPDRRGTASTSMRPRR
jgi:hypothetical protein